MKRREPPCVCALAGEHKEKWRGIYQCSPPLYPFVPFSIGSPFLSTDPAILSSASPTIALPPFYIQIHSLGYQSPLSSPPLFHPPPSPSLFPLFRKLPDALSCTTYMGTPSSPTDDFDSCLIHVSHTVTCVYVDITSCEFPPPTRARVSDIFMFRARARKLIYKTKTLVNISQRCVGKIFFPGENTTRACARDCRETMDLYLRRLFFKLRV